MSEQLNKIYDPGQIEKQAENVWKKGNSFHPQCDSSNPKGSYTIVIPPPNVTAPLHLGHALNNTIQDILIRYRRMQQFKTLWMPGTDHAGIATQTVVEKRILSEQGKKRTDFERTEFVSRVQAWKDEYEARIITQLKAMGCSCDWQRTRFTMDNVCAKAVRATFFKLFSDGLIYRGKRLVNWDPATQTVLADDEVEHETIEGFFWYLKYPLAEAVTVDGQTISHITVATTRPETMLGDTAIAMNPRDPRAEALVGKMVRLPIVSRLIPIVADEHVVLPDLESEDEKARFSTGFLKVTPAHDPNDWEIGLRHDLEVINVMAPDGSISDRYGWEDADTPEAQQLLGLDRFEAREAIVEWFRGEKLLEDVRPYAHEVGHSYRSHVPIEPYLSDQWYVAVKKPIEHLAEKFGTELIEGTDIPANSLAGIALSPLLDGRLKFTPARYAKNYQSWLENLRDWPISRQLWWGHQIPIWSGNNCPPENDKIAFQHSKDEEGNDVFYVCIDHDQPELEDQLVKAGFNRDEDVLDTWFSSALWPFSTMGWPEDTAELKSFYPTSVLCTAREIITLWVSRMVMMGQYCAGDIPFTDVFIHAMIQDGQGRKMSKSLGNGIDPLAIIDSHGVDAMRFTLASMTTDTQDVRMPVELMTLPDGRKVNTSPKFDLGRSFCNKLWNACRFAMMNLESTDPTKFDPKKLTLSDRWILSRLATTVKNVTAELDGFKFSEPLNNIYKFFWNDLCDWYLEWVKPRMQDEDQKPIAQNVLAFVLDSTLRLLHPFIPFITEAIFQNLHELVPSINLQRKTSVDSSDSLVLADWPEQMDDFIDAKVVADIELIQSVIRIIRDIRSKYSVVPSKKLDVSVHAPKDICQLLENNSNLVCSLANLASINIGTDVDKGQNSAAAIVEQMQVYVHDVIDIEAECNKLKKQKENVEKQLKGIEAKLANENFVTRAKPEIVERTQNKKTELAEQLKTIEEHIQQLS